MLQKMLDNLGFQRVISDELRQSIERAYMQGAPLKEISKLVGDSDNSDAILHLKLDILGNKKPVGHMH